MVDFSKPTKINEWADTGVVVEPSESKKDSGWVAPELPPDTFFNWWMNLTGQWTKWFNERFADGGAAEDFIVSAPQGPVDGGDLTLNSGDALSSSGQGGDWLGSAGAGGSVSGTGGAASVTGGAGDGTSGVGGAALLRAGDGAGTGDGGDATVKAGDGNLPGLLFLEAGDAVGATNDGAQAVLRGGNGLGVDQNGGTAAIIAGQSTGDGSSDVALQARDGSTGTGSTPRVAQDYLRCDGSSQRIHMLRRSEMQHSDLTRGPARFVPQTGLPSAPAAGEFGISSLVGNQLHTYNGTSWQAIGVKRQTAIVSATQLVAAGAFDNADFVIPANTLKVGDVIKMYFGGSYDTGSTTTFRTRQVLNATGSVATIVTIPTADFRDWTSMVTYVVTAIGGSGNLRGMMRTLGDANQNTTSVEPTIPIDTTAVNTFHLEFDTMTFGTADCFIANFEVL